jgi:hypothetical protein
MKRSPMVILLAGGTAFAGMVAYTELARTNNNCPPDAYGNRPASCSSSSSSSRGGSGGGYGSYSSSNSSSHSSSTVHGGFGATGAAHGGFGS